MQPRELAAVITKTFGLLLIVYALAIFPSNISTLANAAESSTGDLLAIVAAPSLVPIVFGLILFLLPGTISSAVTGRSDPADQGYADEIGPLIFAGIGLYVTLMAVADLIYFAILGEYSRRDYLVDVFADPYTRADMYTTYRHFGVRRR